METERDTEPDPALAAAVDPWATSHQPTVPHGPAPVYLEQPGPGPDQELPTVPQRRKGHSNGNLIAVVSILAVAVLAGAAAVVVLANRDDTPAGETPAALPYPSDTMLIRVDADNRSDVYLLTPGSAERKPVSTTGGDVLPEWSHDRQRLALTRKAASGENEIWVMKADGTQQERVLGDVSGGRVAWSADDTKLAFLKAGQLFVITLGETEPEQLTTSGDAKDDPFWSPDGKEIAYWVQRNGRRDLYALTVASPDEPGRRITEGEAGPAVDPAWSPDGRTIAYTKTVGPGLSDIWLVDADGSNPRALTRDPAREMDPSWAPDGSWVALTRGDLGQPQVVAVKADGSREQQFTTGAAREGHPCWS